MPRNITAPTSLDTDDEVEIFKYDSGVGTANLVCLAYGAAKLVRYTSIDGGVSWIATGSTDFTDGVDATYLKSLVSDSVNVSGQTRFTIKSVGDDNTVAAQANWTNKT